MAHPTQLELTSNTESRLIPRASEWVRSDAARLLWLSAQLLVVALCARAFRLENAALYSRVLPIAFFGAIVNHLIPAEWRAGWFANLSAVTILAVFGKQGVWILAICGAVIAAAHIGRSVRVRVGLVAALGLALALGRAGVLPVPWGAAVWPIVGSILMFRTAIYLYDLSHQKGKESWAHTFGYFFCLPNVAFPLFPVMDYASFKRSHYAGEAFDTYERGVTWMLRGVVHLIAYRAVYQIFALSPSQVHSVSDLVQYLLANFGLYLRVSGTFHLIVGVLHLYGYRLPETHRLFFLASSYTDLWRRINIYWKDFMQKLVFLPANMGLRRRGETTALVVAMMTVFVLTWFLHSWQWFWILGQFLLSWTDAVFWSILGGILVVGSLWELKKGRRRTLKAPVFKWSAALNRAGTTAITFLSLVFLWGLWNSPTFAAFFTLLHVQPPGAADITLIVILLGAIALAAIVSYRVALTPQGSRPSGGLMPRGSLLSVALIGGVYAAGDPQITPFVPSTLATDLRHLRGQRLNATDQDRLRRGYYEQLQGVNKFNGELWGIYSRRPATWPDLDGTKAMKRVRTPLLRELQPNADITFHGARLRTNAFGMRDRAYTLDKAAGTVRIAVLGQSYVLGSGVKDEEVFDNLVEDRLTAERPVPGVTRYELLNFARSHYSLQQQQYLLTHDRIFDFSPDVVLLVGHPNDTTVAAQYVRATLSAGVALADTFVLGVIERSGVRRGMAPEEAERRLQPYQDALVYHALKEILTSIHARGARAVYVSLPEPNGMVEDDANPVLLKRVSQMGYDAVIDMSTVYDGYDEIGLWVAEWDQHPNAKGHRIIADRLYQELRARPSLIRASSSAPPSRGDGR